MSYTNLVYHIVFRTYRSVPAIDEMHERELYAYAHGYITRHRAKLYHIGARLTTFTCLSRCLPILPFRSLSEG